MRGKYATLGEKFTQREDIIVELRARMNECAAAPSCASSTTTTTTTTSTTTCTNVLTAAARRLPQI